MKVLFIGHYREQSGWGRAAQEYILALDEVCDVVCRPVKLNPVQAPVPSRILELERKSDKNCDVCIQNVLPHLLFYNGNFRNICIPFIDTVNLRGHAWLKYMEKFEIWSPCTTMDLELCRFFNSSVVPVPCDPSKYMSSRKKITVGHDLSNKFVFYSIFDLTPRKNLIGLLKAFHAEFEAWEDVELIIKTGKYGKHPEEVRKQVIDMNNKVCQSLKLPNRKKPIIMTEHLSDEELDGLHNLGDCFVLPSYGEAWCFPAFDAMGFGKFPIVTKGTSCDDYIIDNNTGRFIYSRQTHVSGMTDTFKDIFTAREKWFEPDLCDLSRKMRWVYESYITTEQEKDFQQACFDQVHKFSRQNVGQKMLELLEN